MWVLQSFRASQDLPLYVQQWLLNILYFYSHMDCGYKSLHTIGKTLCNFIQK